LIVAIGADTAAVEWNFPLQPGYSRKAFGGFQGLPLHVDFILNRGAYIIEITNLDELGKDQGLGVPLRPGPIAIAPGSTVLTDGWAGYDLIASAATDR